jgi:hypothetical protein
VAAGRRGGGAGGDAVTPLENTGVQVAIALLVLASVVLMLTLAEVLPLPKWLDDWLTMDEPKGPHDPG